jgi:hypothetical protein
MVAEEAGKVITNTVDALRNQPMMLALVLLQAFVLAAVLYNSINRQAAIDRQFNHVYELLDNCMKGNPPR